MSFPSNKVKLNDLPEAVLIDDLEVTTIYDSDFNSKIHYQITKDGIITNLTFFNGIS